MATSTTEAIIFTSLVFSGIIISVMFSFLLTYSPFAFIALLALYLVGYSVYIFVFLLLRRNELNIIDKPNLEYRIVTYVSVFNFIFAMCMFLVAIVLRKRIYKSACALY